MIRSRLVWLLGALLAALMLGTAAQAADKGPAWASLTVSQQQALAPLQRDWATLEPNRRQKWLELAARFPKMPADERQRVQERMAEWARLTPAQRTQARLQFQEVRQLPAEERHAKWQAYQALSDGERQELAQRAKPAAKVATDTVAKPRPLADAPALGKQLQAASAAAPSSRPVTPIVVQARPGATTTTMSARTVTPVLSQPGAPKIAATAGYVDPATLLPRLGPQRAAVSASAAEAVN